MLNKSKLFLALITLGASKILLAAEGPVTILNTIVLTAQSDELGSELLGKSLNVSNQFIDTSKLKQRSTTLGDALGTELEFILINMEVEHLLLLFVGRKENVLKFYRIMLTCWICLICLQITLSQLNQV